jgi:hypothetical protein
MEKPLEEWEKWEKLTEGAGLERCSVGDPLCPSGPNTNTWHPRR